MMTESRSQPAKPANKPPPGHPGLNLSRPIAYALLGIAAVFYALHFLHLAADFPNHSPWSDWSKYTDEGWYGDAAIRHYFTGHWYWQGDFNPAVALPMLPLLELLWFKFTGVSAPSARALTLCLFGLTLIAFYILIQRHTRPRTTYSSVPLAAPLTIFLLCLSPYLYVFERMAIIEPLLICLTALALLTASHLHPLHVRSTFKAFTTHSASARHLSFNFLKAILPALALGLLLPAMILAKTTAVAIFPAVGYMIWARAGYRIRRAIRLTAIPAVMTAAIWLGYFVLFVRPRYLADYQYLFSANAYTGIELDPLATVVLNTLSDGLWMGKILFPSVFIVLSLALFWRPRLFSNPVVPALLLWIAGYFAFLLYHNNLQPRYYLVVAVPITALVALGIDTFRQSRTRGGTLIASSLAAAVVLAIALPDALMQIGFITHPTYDFEAAARSIAQLVRSDQTHPNLILSISGSDLTLMTGLPSIDDDFGTDDLDVRVKKYRPGWYVAWNDVEDDKADAITPLYTMNRVAAYPAMDDPDRNLLIVYRLDPKEPTTPVHRQRPHTPRPLITKHGQQPSVPQLQH